MSALDDFINDPPAFMRRNLVTYVGIRPSLQGGAEHDFFLIDVGKAARTRSGVFLRMSINKADAGVYEIRYAAALALDDERRATAKSSGRCGAVLCRAARSKCHWREPEPPSC